MGHYLALTEPLARLRNETTWQSLSIETLRLSPGSWYSTMPHAPALAAGNG